MAVSGWLPLPSCLLFLLCCPSIEGTMGCVGSKKEQEPLGKGMGNDDLQNRTQTAHYVKDPTAGNSGNKAVSSNEVTEKIHIDNY